MKRSGRRKSALAKLFGRKKSKQTKVLRRGLRPEALEDRRMLAANPWHNELNPFDVNGDSQITPLDALLVVNMLQGQGAGNLAMTSNSNGAEGEQPPMVDVDGNQQLTPRDALMVIDELGEAILDDTGPTVVQFSYQALAPVANDGALTLEADPVTATFIPILTSATAPFTANMVNDPVIIPQAGTNGADLITRITEFRSASQVVLAEVPPNRTGSFEIRLLTTQLSENQEFSLLASVQDTRDPTAFLDLGTVDPQGNQLPGTPDGVSDLQGNAALKGIDTAILDVSFNPSVLSPANGNATVPSFSAPFVGENSLQTFGRALGENNFGPAVENGTIEEVGATRFDLGNEGALGEGVFPVWSMDFRALKPLLMAGNDTVRSDQAQQLTIDVLTNDHLIQPSFTGNVGENPGSEINLSTPTVDVTSPNLPAPVNVNFGSQEFPVSGFALSLFDVQATTSAGGTATISRGANSAADRIIYTPPANDFVGQDVITYRISSDGTAANVATATVTVTVGNVTIDAPGAQTVNEDATLTFSNGTGITVDALNDNLRVTATATNGIFNVSTQAGLSNVSSANGVVTFEGSKASVNAALANSTFAPPAANFNGSASLQIAVEDIATSDSATSTIPITFAALNDSPINSLPTGPIDAPIGISTPISGISISDPDSGDVGVSITPTVTVAVTQGTLSATASGGAGVTGDNTGSITINGGGSLADVNSVLSSLQYTPPTSENITVTLTVSTDSGNQGAADAPTTDTDQLTINVIKPDLPFAVNDSVNMSEGGAPLAIPLSQLLANDISINTPSDFSDLQYVSNTAASTGTVSYDPGSSTFTYSLPDNDFFGTATFTYTINSNSGDASVTDPVSNNPRESTATVTINIAAVNDPVTANPDSVTAIEDTVATFTGLTANDDNGASNENETLAIVRVAQGTTESTTSVTTAQGGTATLLGNGDIQYSPASNFHGTDSFDVIVSDNGSPTPTEGRSTVTVTVRSRNDNPTASSINETAVEDTTKVFQLADLISAANVGAGAANESGQVVSIVSADTTSSQGGTLSLNTAAGTLTYTPAAEFNGSDSFSITLEDNGTSDFGTTTANVQNDFKQTTATVNLQVSEVNDPPRANNDGLLAAANTTRGNAITFSATPLLSNDTPDGATESSQTLQVVGVRVLTTGAGTATLNQAAQTITYTPADGFANAGNSDNVVLEYTIQDNGTTNGAADPQTATATFELHVQNFIVSTIGGRVVMDSNVNRVVDANEHGIGGVAIVLMGTDFNGVAVGPLMVETTATGHWRFDGLLPGDYMVEQIQPVGTTDAPDSFDPSATNVQSFNPAAIPPTNDKFSLNIPGIGNVQSVDNFFFERGMDPNFSGNFEAMGGMISGDDSGNAVFMLNDNGNWGDVARIVWDNNTRQLTFVRDSNGNGQIDAGDAASTTIDVDLTTDGRVGFSPLAGGGYNLFIYGGRNDFLL